MHKQLTEQERKTSAAKCFAANEKHEAYFVTPDGQCFFDESIAHQHGKVVTGKMSKENVMEINREDVADEIKAATSEGEKKGSALKKRVAAIKATKTLDELTAMEIGNDEPKEVQDALNAQLEGLLKK